MNKTENILNAWITIEQLSEGDIDKKDKALKPLKYVVNNENNYKDYFLEFMKEQKVLENVSDKKFEKSGLVIYFGIFEFQKVIDLLREKFNIPNEYNELTMQNKFTVALYFDKEMNFLADKLFYTMSGYLYEHLDFPEDLNSYESELKNNLDREFKEDFNRTFSDCLKKYTISKDHFRFKFLKNVETDDVNLHSFFIDDLEKAKKITTQNLERYFKGFKGEFQNLDSNKDSANYDESVFEDKALQPKFYPLGRFPTNPDFALSFMQQVAVNLSLNDKNNIRSVNGPPGTGKTTLLKDVFADLVVQQAKAITKLTNKQLTRELVYYKAGKFAELPENISANNMVVTSSNNGAVQNIVKELPIAEDIAKEFRQQLVEADYFKNLSNSTVKKEGFGRNSKLVTEVVEEKNWGLFSIEGGSSANIDKLLQHMELVEKELSENFIDNPAVYEEFSDTYTKLELERSKMQKQSEEIYKLRKLKQQYQIDVVQFEKTEKQWQERLSLNEKDSKLHIEKYEKEQRNNQSMHANLVSELEELQELQVHAERKYDLVHAEKPSFLFLLKIFNKTKTAEYFKKLNDVSEELDALLTRKKDVLKEKKVLEKEKGKIEGQIVKINEEHNKLLEQFTNWAAKEEKKIEALSLKIVKIEKEKSIENIKELDFSLSYEDLQKSNPWFTKEFRILQSELFIKALKVRKQFLFDNKKSVKAAIYVWGNQGDFVGKEDGMKKILAAWNWVNFTIPVISTTFASFGRMFKNIEENALGNVFVDEAGQALPQASVGAIFRSKKILVVGDPSQIKPVLTLDTNILTLIGRHYKVDETFVSADASTQSLIDATSQFGFRKNEEEWIGIPLWVHRRSDYPMFTISNEISYNNLMVQGKQKADAYGKSEWLHVEGKAVDKFVKEQAELLKIEISKRLSEDENAGNEIYVISPFRNVAFKLAKELDGINFTIRENNKAKNVGTVHTFQGKEAKIVYLVLGADSESAGAARWAVTDPNIMNVAATRAKKEFYIIGDKKLYSSLGSEVASKTMSIISAYNN